NGKSRIVGHGHRNRLAPARVTLESDALRIDRFVALKIIQRAARTPGPRTKRAPFVGFARLTFVDQSDNALRETLSVIGLNAVGRELRIAPAFGEKLLSPGRPNRGLRRCSARGQRARTKA